MIRRSPIPSLTDIVEACEQLRTKFNGMALADVQDNWEARWVVVHHDLAPLETACRAELAAEQNR